MGKVQTIPIKDAFSWWLIDWYGRNKIPTNYSSYLRNARIENKALTVRKWYKTIVTDTVSTHVRGIKGNSIQNKLVCASNSKLKLINLTTNTVSDIGSIGTDTNVNIFNHWKYSIILTWVSKPYVYDGTTLTLLTTTAPDENVLIWVPFSWFTVVAGNKAATYNNIYFSRPVTIANPEYAYDWVWSGSEKRNMQSKVLWLTSSLNNLFIFCQDTIEYTNKDSLSTIWWTFSFYSSPIWDWDQLLNYRCAATANDRAFYITKNMTWKTINYVPWTIDPAIGSLSDRPLVSIKNLLQTKLAEDQTDSFMIRKDDLICWYGKSANSTIIDIGIIYDITNDIFLVDDNIYYSCMTKFNGLFYAGSYLNWDLIQDDINHDDDWGLTPFRYKTMVINFGNPLKRKLFKGRELAWELNKETYLEIDTIIDSNIISNEIIDGSKFIPDIWWLWIGWAPIWWQPIGWALNATDELTPFERVADDWMINIKGKNILLDIKNTWIGWRFYCDFLAMILTPIGTYTLSDKWD